MGFKYSLGIFGVITSLVGRESEVRVLGGLLDRVREQGGSLVVSGEPGIGKSALVRAAGESARGLGMMVLTATGVQSEAQLPFAGLHQLLRPVLPRLGDLAAPQRDTLLGAFGLADAPVPDPFLAALAALNLLTASAAQAPVLVIAEDAHWLDRATCDVLAFVARRLEFDPVVLIATIRDGFSTPLSEAALPALPVAPLPAPAAAALLDSRAPGLAAAVRERLLSEAAGNPLALVELPVAFQRLGRAAELPVWLPLTTRLERAFAARAGDLPAATRTALLVAAVNDGSLLGEVVAATAILAGGSPTVGALEPAVAAGLVEIDGEEYRFCNSLVRTAIRQEASVSQRHAAHAALADVLAGQPERRVWHRAASVVGTDEGLAGELEQTAARALRRGGMVAAVMALQRAAELGEGSRRAGRLLRAAELAFELGREDLVGGLLNEAGPLDLRPRERVRAAWIRESFADGKPGDGSRARWLATIAGQAGADGDTDLALKLLYGAALRCWWAEPGPAAREEVVAAAERLEVSPGDPRLLVVLAFAAPIERGAVVIDRLSGPAGSAGADAAATRLAGNAAMAVGSFDIAAACLGASATSLRAEGRLGLLARALALQAWSTVHLGDLATAIPAAEESRRLAQETNQPLIMATAQAIQALLAALRGDQDGAAEHAAQAERVCVPIGASAVLAAVQLGRGVAALAGGRPGDALAELRRIHDRADPAYHAAIRCFTIGDLAEAARRCGAPAGIGAFVTEMEAAARQTPSPLLHAGLRYARALLADDAQAGALFEAALRSDLSRWPFLRARVQLSYGEWLHQQRRNAASRAPLRAAREAFDALGTVPWSERARQQLRATGETSRPRTPEAQDRLTPQELQIVQMAADGLSNREIGQMLYLSHRTVSSHLYRAFPKLGITSRTELRGALSAGSPGPARRLAAGSGAQR
jgi:DNA-binding CsgD family transcriptional regulator